MDDREIAGILLGVMSGLFLGISIGLSVYVYILRDRVRDLTDAIKRIRSVTREYE